MTARKRSTCAYCGLAGHLASTCYVSARGAFKPDAIDRAIARIDFERLRDRPAEMRNQISRSVRRALREAL